MIKVEPMIRIAGVSKTFSVKDNKVEALKNVSLDIAKGDIYGIIGMSGAGKSTLVRCLNFLERPTEGTVYVEGQDLSTLDAKQLRQLRKHVAMIFQNFNLLPRQSAVENVELPLLYAGVPKKERREMAKEALVKVGLEERMNFKPTQLSGGQKQRVAIARAMVNSPALLLADEPTGALDTKSGEQVMEIFENLNSEGVTIVMITHEKEIAEHAKRIMYIRDGELSESSGGDSL